MKKYLWIVSVVAVLIILGAIWFNDFNKRYNETQNEISYNLEFVKVSGIEDKYYIYKTESGREFYIKNIELSKNGIIDTSEIKIILKKTNNLIEYLTTWLNENATIEWKNGILYKLGEIKNV